MKLLCLRSVIGGLILAASATASSAEMYRWVDENGRVHFGDRPPTDAKAEDVSGDLTPINSIRSNGSRRPILTTATRSRVSQKVDDEYRERQLREKQEKQQKMKKACDKARSDLEAIQGRVVFLDNNGKEVRRTERERQQIAEKLQREIKYYCG